MIFIRFYSSDGKFPLGKKLHEADFCNSPSFILEKNEDSKPNLHHMKFVTFKSFWLSPSLTHSEAIIVILMEGKCVTRTRPSGKDFGFSHH